MKKELLLIELCREVLDQGIHTERFDRLWMETGIRLESDELDIADKLRTRVEEPMQVLPCRMTIH